MMKSLFGMAAFSLLLFTTSAHAITKIAIGSCMHQDKPQPIWNTIASQSPDLFILLGDNIYGDTEDMTVMKAKYDKLSRIPEFASFRRNFPIIATWDDHDFGANDAGYRYPKKEESKRLFLEFFGEPAGSPRWSRQGIYTSYEYGKPGERVQVILLDTRWSRSDMKRDASGYIPDFDPSKTVLGDEQWAWLEEELKKPADLRIIGSSIQFVSEEHPYEKWGNHPLEKKRMIDLLEKTGATNTVFISGDRHHGELSCEDLSARRPGWKLCDLTSSGMTNGRIATVTEPNRHRVRLFDQGNHYGMLSIDWKKNGPEVTLDLRDPTGGLIWAETIH